MVAHQILVLLVEVRILVGQPKTPPPRRFFVPIGIGNLELGTLNYPLVTIH